MVVSQYTTWYYHTQKTMVYHGKFSWYTMVWYTIWYICTIVYHILCGVTISSKPWHFFTVYHGMTMWYYHMVIPWYTRKKLPRFSGHCNTTVYGIYHGTALPWYTMVQLYPKYHRTLVPQYTMWYHVQSYHGILEYYQTENEDHITHANTFNNFNSTNVCKLLIKSTTVVQHKHAYIQTNALKCSTFSESHTIVSK